MVANLRTSVLIITVISTLMDDVKGSNKDKYLLKPGLIEYNYEKRAVVLLIRTVIIIMVMIHTVMRVTSVINC